ncbi:hypothetical protein CcCBS67573_g09246 [Chytriomyces confervae]|uniref:Uncharacterized protein n=1 Tax=Chytriomyces confervae TaxID=246404 RepID=A0A507E0Y3_9FUNG|nr:hypothetical protein CcCBS67573_g09246 [Chytriomyces confervae]
MQLESAIQVMQTDRLDFEKRTAEVQSTAISEAVSKTRNELDARHREEKERLEKQVVQKNEEIRVKEDELQRAVKKEHKKYTELFKAFQEIAEESNQMSKSAKSEHDLRAVARKLKHLVKDQKLKIAELMSKNEASMSQASAYLFSMQEQLISQHEAFESLRSAFEECKNERDALHSDVLKVSEKLQERNTSIAHLELEESKVKSVFAAKEAKLVQERDDLLRTREISVDEVKRHYKMSRLKGMERERDCLFETTKRLKLQVTELETAQDAKIQELKCTSQETDRFCKDMCLRSSNKSADITNEYDKI